jgi:hypothetical protein
MASSYSPNLRVELQTPGEGSDAWGSKLNDGALQLLEDAIAGRVTVTHDDTANYTLTTANGATDEARRMMLNITGTLTAARNVVCPTVPKLYIAKNATTGGFALTLKTSGGTGISIANGDTMLLMCDGTNVIDAIGFMNLAGLAVGALALNGNVTLGTSGRLVAVSKDLGTITTGTVTPDPRVSSLHHYTNNGAHTLAPSTNKGSTIVEITNDASAAAITTSGFTKVAGDAFTTVNGDRFLCSIVIAQNAKLLTVQQVV